MHQINFEHLSLDRIKEIIENHEQLELSPEDERVMRYLRGETLEITPAEAKDGWILVTVAGFPLGFGKAKNGNVKNKLLPGWRMNA